MTDPSDEQRRINALEQKVRDLIKLLQQVQAVNATTSQQLSQVRNAQGGS